MLKQLQEFRQIKCTWHIPVLAGLSVGIPILVGYFTGNLARVSKNGFAKGLN